jgi:uncharacterized protein (DUF1330 family)
MGNGEVLVLIEVVRVKDPEMLAQYQAGARAQIREHGGRVIGRGGGAYFGEPEYGTLLVQHWPSELAFRQWQASDEYIPLLAKRSQAADIRIAIISKV